MTRIWTACSLGLALIGNTTNVTAQAPRPTVFGVVGVANVHRTEDQSFGTELNVGGGLGVECSASALRSKYTERSASLLGRSNAASSA